MLNYVIIPSPVLVTLRGKSKALQAFCCLSANRNTRTNRTHFMSKPAIADMAGISRRHIYNVIDALEALGIIEVVAERRGEYMWYLPCLESVETSEADLAKKTAEITQQMGGSHG